jgi:D-glycero-D-manno-heptose 1,7-bisphosphate phosphatase
MSEEDLSAIHGKMLNGIHEAGGRIDKVYHSPHLKESRSFYRKPMPGMALKAKKDFPSIDFKRSVMVGDTISDMKFGKTQSMVTTIIETDSKIISTNHKIIDFSFGDLASFTQYINDLTE